MRFYIVVEGSSGEAKIYPKWIQYINKHLTRVYYLSDVLDNTFFLISGNGYPNYLSVIENAIDDVNESQNFDCLVVAVDSENMSCQEKHDEIKAIIGNKLKTAKYKIIIQHFCFETWALGNKVACRKNTSDPILLEYKRIHDVRSLDPELLPSYKDMNRSQFAFRYLKAMINDWYPHASYTKSNPTIIMDEQYFVQIKKRMDDTGHIQSFKVFLEAFINA